MTSSFIIVPPRMGRGQLQSPPLRGGDVLTSGRNGGGGSIIHILDSKNYFWVMISRARRGLSRLFSLFLFPISYFLFSTLPTPYSLLLTPDSQLPTPVSPSSNMLLN